MVTIETAIIFYYNRTFLPELQRIKQSPMKLGQIFIDHVGCY